MTNTTQRQMDKAGIKDTPPVPQGASALQTRWNSLQGKARTRWSQLTDDDIKQIGGRYDMLVEALQRRYGFDEKRAGQEIDYLLREQ